MRQVMLVFLTLSTGLVACDGGSSSAAGSFAAAGSCAEIAELAAQIAVEDGVDAIERPPGAVDFSTRIDELGCDAELVEAAARELYEQALEGS